MEKGWDTERRKRYLKALRRFEEFPGGRWYVRTAQDLRTEAVAALTDTEMTELADLLLPATPEVAPPPVTVDPANYVQDWRLEDFANDLGPALADRDLESGQKAFHEAACAACHRIAGDPATTNAVLGPDLSGVGSRFDSRTLLESIIHPSLVIGEKYRNPAGPNVSTMPPGLINGLEKDQILDLLAYLSGQTVE